MFLQIHIETLKDMPRVLGLGFLEHVFYWVWISTLVHISINSRFFWIHRCSAIQTMFTTIMRTAIITIILLLMLVLILILILILILVVGHAITNCELSTWVDSYGCV